MTKKILVCGAGGFIGSHLVRHIKQTQDAEVVGVDLKHNEYIFGYADRFYIKDLRDPAIWTFLTALGGFDEMYQLAADMGGVEYINSGAHDPDVMINSMQINLNAAKYIRHFGKTFFSSSACVYPEFNQEDPDNPMCVEGSVYPAQPDSEYGWEKLFSERLYAACGRNYNSLAMVGRFHNIYGEEGNWIGGKEKAPAALCRKVASVESGGTIDVFGDGKQSRSFLHVDDCIQGVLAVMEHEVPEPVNIGSTELITINDFVNLIADIAGKEINIAYIPGPTGVRGRTSDNTLMHSYTGWKPEIDLRTGIERTYRWIEKQLSM